MATSKQPKNKAKTKTAKKTGASKTEDKVQTKAAGRAARYEFDILGDDAQESIHEASEALQAISERRKNRPTAFKTLAEIRRSMVLLRSFRMQHALGCYGLPEATLIEIIGGDHIGKSTLVHWILGGAMLQGIPAALQETENKPLTDDWAKRAMHSDPVIAAKMLERLRIFPGVFELGQMESNLYDWVRVMREDVKVPLSTPLIMAVDSWSKLMNADESAGFYDYGDNMDAERKKKMKGTNEGSNFVHAKWAQAWCRKLPSFLAKNNVILIVVSHQNDAVDMSGGKTSYMSPEQGNLYNKKKIGGRAFNQNAAIQLIMTRAGVAKDGAGDKIGSIIKMRVDKNSYGPNNRTMEWILQNDKFTDTETFIEPSLVFHEDLGKWLADEKLLGITVTRKRYTCPELGLVNATSAELEAALLANEDVLNRLGNLLRIRGYENVVDKIKDELQADVPEDE